MPRIPALEPAPEEVDRQCNEGDRPNDCFRVHVGVGQQDEKAPRTERYRRNTHEDDTTQSIPHWRGELSAEIERRTECDTCREGNHDRRETHGGVTDDEQYRDAQQARCQAEVSEAAALDVPTFVDLTRFQRTRIHPESSAEQGVGLSREEVILCSERTKCGVERPPCAPAVYVEDHDPGAYTDESATHEETCRVSRHE